MRSVTHFHLSFIVPEIISSPIAHNFIIIRNQQNNMFSRFESQQLELHSFALSLTPIFTAIFEKIDNLNASSSTDEINVHSINIVKSIDKAHCIIYNCYDIIDTIKASISLIDDSRMQREELKKLDEFLHSTIGPSQTQVNPECHSSFLLQLQQLYDSVLSHVCEQSRLTPSTHSSLSEAIPPTVSLLIHPHSTKDQSVVDRVSQLDFLPLPLSSPEDSIAITQCNFNASPMTYHPDTITQLDQNLLDHNLDVESSSSINSSLLKGVKQRLIYSMSHRSSHYSSIHSLNITTSNNQSSKAVCGYSSQLFSHLPRSPSRIIPSVITTPTYRSHTDTNTSRTHSHRPSPISRHRSRSRSPYRQYPAVRPIPNQNPSRSPSHIIHFNISYTSSMANIAKYNKRYILFNPP